MRRTEPDKSGTYRMNAINRAEKASPRPEHDHVERRPEYDHLLLHGGQCQSQVVFWRERRGDQDDCFHSVGLEEFERLDHDTRPPGFTDQMDQFSGVPLMKRGNLLGNFSSEEIAILRIRKVGVPSPKAVPPGDEFHHKWKPFGSHDMAQGRPAKVKATDSVGNKHQPPPFTPFARRKVGRFTIEDPEELFYKGGIEHRAMKFTRVNDREASIHRSIHNDFRFQFQT